MTDGTRINSNESFSSMKQWLMTKFQTSWEGNQPSVLPTIVISRGSDKSINKMTSPANSPVLRRPSPLVNSWKNYKETPLTPQTAPHTTSGRSFWASQTSNSPPYTTKIPRHNLQSTLSHSESFKRTVQSMPCTPIQSNSSMYMPVKMSKSENYNNRIRSPLLRFSERNNIPMSGRLTPSQSSACSRSDLDSESLCGTCGQRKLYGSRDLVGFPETLVDDSGIHSAVSSPKFNRRQLNLRRTSSCRAPDNLEKQIFQKSATITKARSNLDVQKKSTSRGKRVKRTGSKESNRSTISLTRSWSINLDTFRIVKNDFAKSSNIDTRKLSLNDNELRRLKDERRRSSILRLLCHEHTDSEKDEREGKGDTGSLSDTGSEVDILEYSPKVTRATKFVNSDPIQDFRPPFESFDSIKEPSIYGQIKIMFQYFNEKKELQLTILKGSNVASGQTGILGVYTKVCLMPGKLQKKIGDDRHDTHNPVFYEPFTFKMSLDKLLTQELRIKLYNKPGIFSVSEPIGECRVPLYHYDLTAVTVIWLDLNKCKGQKVCR